MKLYKLSQNINNGYDTYDSAVVCAGSEEEARKIHPSEYVTHYNNGKWYGTYSVAPFGEYETENGYYSWIPFERIGEIVVEYIGEADKAVKNGVIVASFNAG